MTSLPFHAGSSRSSHVAGFLPPTSFARRSLLEMKPKMPVYQPVQRPVASLNFASMSLAFGAMYASSRPSLPERVVDLARATDEDVRLRAVLLGADAGLQLAGRGQWQYVHRDAGVGLLERAEELVVRRFVERPL